MSDPIKEHDGKTLKSEESFGHLLVLSFPSCFCLLAVILFVFFVYLCSLTVNRTLSACVQ